MGLNYNLEKIIHYYNASIIYNENNANLGLIGNNIELMALVKRLIEIKVQINNKNISVAVNELKSLNKILPHLQSDVINETIMFYKNHPELDYPTDYQPESEQAESSIKQVEPPAQNIDQINFDKLMTEISDIKALPSEFKNLQRQIENITTAIKESADKQIELKTEKIEAAPSDTNLAPQIESLVKSLNKQEQLLTALTNPTLAYNELQSNMSNHIKDMNDIVTKNVESSRAKFELTISGDFEKWKAGMNSEAENLVKDLGTIIKTSFDNNNAKIEQYLSDVHNNAQNIIELRKSHEVSKITWGWFFSGLIVVLLLVNFFTVIYMKNNISTTTSTNVINAIKQIRDAQIKSSTPPAVTNHKKY